MKTVPERPVAPLRIKCSIFSNGSNGWGVRVLGGLKVRLEHFDRSASPVWIEVDGADVDFNVDKRTFWNGGCGELIRKPVEAWAKTRNLKTGDHVWLVVLEPKKRFRLTDL